MNTNYPAVASPGHQMLPDQDKHSLSCWIDSAANHLEFWIPRGSQSVQDLDFISIDLVMTVA